MFRIFRISAMLFALTVGLTLAGVVFPVLSGPEDAVLYAAPVATGNEDCSSWGDACTLQTALSNAVSSDQIWVQAGVHKPGATVSDTFALVNGVAVYGGFAGTETALDQRDWEANITVLSGDVDNNDLTDPNGVVTDTANITGTNSHHVVTSFGASNSTVLDGFIVTAGKTNFIFPESNGGGMYNNNGNPSISNVRFWGNSAIYGGGFGNLSGNPLLSNVTFSGNSANSGAGMISWSNSHPSLTNVSFYSNTAKAVSGGGMDLINSDATLANVNFESNFAEGFGGGLRSQCGHLNLTNVTFKNNKALTHGGGLYMAACVNRSSTLNHITFTNNSAVERGGGLYWVGTNSSTLDNLIFENNNAEEGGGLFLNANLNFQNSFFINNTADQGGGMWITGSPFFSNATFYGNSADLGGGIYTPIFNSSPIFVNFILWGNVATNDPQIHNGSNPIISYSDIEGSGGSGAGWDPTLGTDGGGNIDADPLFIDPASGNVHLQRLSPTIDAGNNLSVTVTTDLDGNPRFVDIPTVPDNGNGTPPLVDMGAYEKQLTTTLFASPSGLTSGTCESWPNACTLTYTLSLAEAGDQIWVQAGVHKPGATVSDTFGLVNGVAVYGGFEGTETALDQRDWEANVTVLSGDVDNNDLTDPNGVVTDTANIVGDNAYHVVSSTGVLSDTVLDGFTITAGQAHGTYSNSSGGGMHNSSGDPTLANLHFYGNFAYHSGGGMTTLNASNPTLENVIFSNNTAFLYGGGGMQSINSNPVMTNITFTHNTAGGGGGMEILGGLLTMENVTFNDNFARNAGGGMFIQEGNHALTNITFRNNSVHNPSFLSLGGGIYIINSDAFFRDVIFDGNSSDDRGGGIDVFNSNFTMQNALFHNNTTAGEGGGISLAGGNSLLINVTFSMNHAETGGGISAIINQSQSIMSNVIFWGNTAVTGSQIYRQASSTLTISYSDIEGSGGSGAGWDPTLGTDGGGNIDADPLFVAPLNRDLHLDLASPAIDAGNNLSVTVPTDLDGNPRLADIPTIPDTGNGTPPLVDMGAYEAQPIHLAPTFTSTPVTTATQDIPYTYTLTTLDLNGDVVTITAPTLPAWLTLTDHGDGTATLSGTPTNAEVGAYPILLRVTDETELFAEQAFTLTVLNVNDAPTFTSIPITTGTQNTSYLYTITTNDPDLLYGEALTLTAPTLPEWLTLTDHGNGTATLSGTPTQAEVGEHMVILRVTDSNGAWVEQTFVINVTETGQVYFIYLPLIERSIP